MKGDKELEGKLCGFDPYVSTLSTPAAAAADAALVLLLLGVTAYSGMCMLPSPLSSSLPLVLPRPLSSPLSLYHSLAPLPFRHGVGGRHRDVRSTIAWLSNKSGTLAHSCSLPFLHSEYAADGSTKEVELDQILLNGTNIAMVEMLLAAHTPLLHSLTMYVSNTVGARRPSKQQHIGLHKL